MGRRKRLQVKGDSQETVAQAHSPGQEPRLGGAVRVRFTCPCCGMMPEVERLLQAPYAPEVRIQKFGGSLPATGDEPMRPYMVYEFGKPKQLLLEPL